MSEQEQAKQSENEELEQEVTETEKVQAEEVQEEVDSAYEELNKRYLRLLADFDNYKRRTSTEKEDIYKYGAMNLIKGLLPVLDSFELAIKNAPTDEASAAYHEGFEKIWRQLMDGLGKEGLERIEALGSEYDPNFHEAIMVVEDDSQPANTVIDELRAGYKFKDKVLRPTVCRVTGNN